MTCPLLPYSRLQPQILPTAHPQLVFERRRQPQLDHRLRQLALFSDLQTSELP